VCAQRTDFQRFDRIISIEDGWGEAREMQHSIQLPWNVEELCDIVFVEWEPVVVEGVV